MNKFDKRIKIKVTQKHIHKGMCGNDEKCAVSLAVQEQLGVVGVTTSGCNVEFTAATKVAGKTIHYTFEADLPVKASRFIENFDHNKLSVKPITFMLKPVLVGVDPIGL